MRVQFVLISEGPSDNGLVSHLEALCVHIGADEAAGVAFDRQRLPGPIGSKVAEKLRAAMILEPRANLFFIHRDADAPDPEPRYAEIEQAVQHCALKQAWVAVVPVQETEAWLLLDTDAIRKVAGKLRGRQMLGLPSVFTVEATKNPKELLQNAIVIAGDETGRRLEKLKRDFPTHRQSLLQELSVNGPQRDIPSWQRMVEDMRLALEAMAQADSGTKAGT
jgi:hypothetical protein